MIDLIIPAFNNIKGLYQSLLSIGIPPKNNLFVTIVDDHSENRYEEIITIFQKFFPIQVLSLSINHGPGYARQYGISKTHHDYIMFLDCGDVISSPDSISRVINTIKQNPNIYVFNYHYLYEINQNEYIDRINDNTFHGRIFKRNFLEECALSIPTAYSYMNEDIVFNKAVNLYMTPETYWESQEEVLLLRTFDANSLTHKNHNEAYYNKNIYGILKNIPHMLTILKNSHIDSTEYIYEFMCAIYIFYLSTKNRYPQYLNNAYKDAQEFYLSYFKPIKNLNPSLFYHIYYNFLAQELLDPYTPLKDKYIGFDIEQFFLELELNN